MINFGGDIEVVVLGVDSTRDGLEAFSKTLMSSTQFNDFRTLACLTYGDVPSGSSIVSR